MEILTIFEQRYQVERISDGSYAVAYRWGDNVILNVKNCRFREALSEIRTPIPHLPEISKIAHGYYLMPYYEVPKRGSKYHTLMDELNAIRWDYRKDREAFIKKLEVKHASFIPAMLFIFDFVNSNDDVYFDFGLDNIGIDKEGRLILRDPVDDDGATLSHHLD